MLVLSRKEGERIVIGQSIIIAVIETSGGRVRLGIDAPAGVSIMREEIVERISQLHNGDLKNDELGIPALLGGPV